MLKSFFQSGLCLVLLSIAQACQSSDDQPAARLTPAYITAIDQARLVKHLEDALGRSGIQTVPANLIGARTLSVPPPRPSQYETRSPALPTSFNVMQAGQVCYLVDEKSGTRHKVETLKCAPL